VHITPRVRCRVSIVSCRRDNVHANVCTELTGAPRKLWGLEMFLSRVLYHIHLPSSVGARQDHVAFWLRSCQSSVRGGLLLGKSAAAASNGPAPLRTR